MKNTIIRLLAAILVLCIGILPFTIMTFASAEQSTVQEQQETAENSSDEWAETPADKIQTFFVESALKVITFIFKVFHIQISIGCGLGADGSVYDFTFPA